MKFRLATACAAAIALAACASLPKGATLDDVLAAWNANRDRALALYCALSPADRDAALKALRLKTFLGERAAVVCPAPGLIATEPYIIDPG